MMDGGLAILRPFNTISVISGQWAVGNERLCIVEPPFTIEKISISGGAPIWDR